MEPKQFKEPNLARPLNISYRVLLSPEYRSLSSTAKDVYTIFLYKRTFAKYRKGKPGRLTNNSIIQFTEDDAVFKWKIKRSSFRRAITKLKEANIIGVTHRGYGGKGDVSLYELKGMFDGIVTFAKR